MAGPPDASRDHAGANPDYAMENAYYIHWNPGQKKPRPVRSKLDEARRKYAQQMISESSDVPLRKGKR